MGIDKVEQAVILAGGMGVRMKPFTDNHPKPMYSFQGKPFIEYLVRQVKGFGIKKLLLLLGYMPEEIQKFLGDGKKYGIDIEYNITPVEYDTGNRLKDAYQQLNDEFLLMYCDNYCPIDFEQLSNDFYENGADIQISAYANKDNYTKDNLKIASNGRIQYYDKKRVSEDLRGVDIGYALLKKSVLNDLKNEGNKIVNFEAEIYPTLVERGKMYATLTEHRYYSIGSWQRIELTEFFFNNSKTIFLDRDGTLNVRQAKACYVERPADFQWLDGAIEAIKLLKVAGYRLILISNQPGIARGNLSEDMLAKIHEKMQNELKEHTGYTIDAIYVCPHNWEEGCECRKPKPGMFYKAQKDFSLNLSECFMIGDDERDMQAGKAAGCECFMVNDENCLLDIVLKRILKKND